MNRAELGSGPWFVRGNSRNYGPFSLRQLGALVRAGKLTQRHRVSVDGHAWHPAQCLTELWVAPQSVAVQRSGESDGGIPDWDRDVLVRESTGRLTLHRDCVNDVLFVVPDGICFGQKWLNTLLPALQSSALESISVGDAKFRRSVRRIPWTQVESATVSWPCLVGAAPRGMCREGQDFCIQVRKEEPIRMFVEGRGATRLIDALRHRLGERLQVDAEPYSEPRLARSWRLFDALVIPFGVMFFYALIFLVAEAVLGGSYLAFAVSAGLVSMGALCWLVPGAIWGWFRAVDCAAGRLARQRLVRRLGVPVCCAMALCWVPLVGPLAMLIAAIIVAVRYRGAVIAFPRARLGDLPLRAVKRNWFDRACDHWPRAWSNSTVGNALKIVALLLLVSFVWLATDPAASEAALRLFGMVAFPVAMELAEVGHRASIGSALAIRAADARAPIVYLRSFRDDGQGTLESRGWMTSLLGLRTTDNLSYLGPLADANPVRIMRLIMGRSGDTVEEQLAGHVKAHGPFIAIGRPTEGLPTAGAARDYVDDDAWKDRVLDWLGRAQLVIVQPGVTEGIRWEINRVLRTVRPEKVLFVLSSFDRSPEAWESFVLWLRQKHGIDCPLYRGSGAFLLLNGRRAQLSPIRMRHPIVWPLIGCSADIDSVLADRCGTGNGRAAAPGWSPFGLTAAMAVILAAAAWFAAEAALFVVVALLR